MRPAIVFGTRPELIKLAPVVHALRASGVEPLTIFTGQHEGLVLASMDALDLGPVLSLGLMRPDQRPESFLARCLERLGSILRDEQVDSMLVQGDTTSTLAGALAAFYRQIPVGHVEAGLRTRDLASPFPEEAHRQLVTRVARWNFCPTGLEVDALAAEGVSRNALFETGNTVIDALRITCERLSLSIRPAAACDLVLVTMHRRESFGGGLAAIAAAVARLARMRPGLRFRLPLHPNPAVAAEVLPMLTGVRNVEVCAPLSYDGFVRTLCETRFLVSDSGGLQEEAPWLGRPVVVVREKTERAQAVAAGASFLCGPSDPERIVKTALPLTEDTPTLQHAARRRWLFGDGHAAERIVALLAA